MNPATDILVVDDEPSLQATLRRVLERAGYRVATCGSADEAVAFLSQTRVAMVLSDLHLGGRSGLELLAEVKRRWPASLRLVITAAMDPALMDAIGTCDVHRCIAKPFENAALERVIARLFDALVPPAAARAG